MATIEQRADQLFLEVVELAAHEREAALRPYATSEPAVLARVRELLATDNDNSDGLLERPAHRSLDDDDPVEIAGFRVISKLGEGGMGMVYRAEQEQPRRAVALKVIRPGLASEESLRRLELEAELLGRMQHGGIAQVYAAGMGKAVFPHGTVERRFIAMELVEGVNIVEYCRDRELRHSQVLELLARVADAVHHAHEAGTVHRDLKPANILVTQGGEPKVLDFGAARITDASREHLTQWTAVGQIVGTLHYMSPEQAAGGGPTVDARSDVYSLGVVLFELLTGHTPYQGRDTSVAAMLRHLEYGTPPRVERHDPRLAGDVATVVHHALERDPVDRYINAAALARDLRHASRHEPIESRAPSSLYRARKFVRRHQRLVVATAAVFLVLLTSLVAVGALATRLEGQRAHAARVGYLNVLRSTASAILRGDTGHASKRLADLDEDLRGWEWEHLASRIPDAIDAWRCADPSLFEHTPLLSSVRSGLRFDPSGDQAIFTFEMRGTGLSTIAWPLDDRPGLKTWRHGMGLEDRGGDFSAVTGAMFDPPRAVVPIPSSPSKFRVLGPAGHESHIDLTADRATQLSGAVSRPGTKSGFAFTNKNGVSFVFRPSLEIDGPYRRPRTGWSILPPSSRAVIPGVPGESSDRPIIVFADIPERLDVYDISTGELLHSFPHDNDWSDWRLSKDGRRLVAVTEYGDINAWDTGTFEPLEWSPLRDRRGGIKCLDIATSSSRFVTGGVTGVVSERDMETGAILSQHGHPKAMVLAVGYEPMSDSVISADDNGLLCRWAPPPDDPWVLRGHQSYVYPTAVSPDGSLVASGSWDETLRLWDAKTGVEVARHAHKSTGTGNSTRILRQMAFLSRGQRIAVTSGGFGTVPHTFHVLDLRSGAIQHAEQLGASAAIAADDSGARLAITTDGGEAVVRDTETWEAVGRTPAMGGLCQISSGPTPLLAIRVPDPTRWLIDILHLGNLEQVCRIDLGDRSVSSAAFSPDARRIAFSTDRNTFVFHARTGHAIAELRAPEPRVHAVAFSPDGTRIATGGHDGLVNIWDGEQYDLRAELLGHEGYVYSLAWSKQPDFLVSGSGDGTVRMWDRRDLRTWSESRRDRTRLMARLAPIVAERLRSIGDPTATYASLAGETSWTERERQVAIQALLGLVNGPPSGGD